MPEQLNPIGATAWLCTADRFLPDKAIDLVDEAAARLKMEATSKPEALDEIERKVSRLSAAATTSCGCWPMSANIWDESSYNHHPSTSTAHTDADIQPGNRRISVKIT